jgi:F0F1-type ATP synthase membrane subunit c/vacuolar-type H+-ATPase subunit K
MADTSYAQRIFTFRMIYLALVATLGIYGVIAWMQTQRGEPVRPVEPMFLYALGGVALLQMVMIPFLRRMLMPPLKAPTALSDDPSIDGEAAEGAIAKLFAANIISWALCESIAIFGLVLVFLSLDFHYYPPFAAAALLNFLFYRPSLDDLQAAVRATRP